MAFIALCVYPVLAVYVLAISDERFHMLIGFGLVLLNQIGLVAWLKSKFAVSKTERAVIGQKADKAAKKAEAAAEKTSTFDQKVDQNHLELVDLIAKKSEQEKKLIEELADLFAKKAKAEPVVLVCEDELDIQAIISRFLKLHGVNIRLASTVKEAVELLDIDPPAVALVDLMMPDTSGEELIKAIRARKLDCFVVVMSGVDTQRLEDARQAGADAVLSKPFDLPRVQALVDEGIKRREHP